MANSHWNVLINGKSLQLKVLREPKDHASGYQHQETPPGPNEGLMFLFPDLLAPLFNVDLVSHLNELDNDTKGIFQFFLEGERLAQDFVGIRLAFRGWHQEPRLLSLFSNYNIMGSTREPHTYDHAFQNGADT